MITSSEIIHKNFSIEIDGYCKEEVDQYLDQKAWELDSLNDSYGNLRRKVIGEGKRPELVKRESLKNIEEETAIPEFASEENGYNKTEVNQYIGEVEREITWLRLNNQNMRKQLQERKMSSYEPKPRHTSDFRQSRTQPPRNNTCPRCGNAVQESHQFCPSCGFSLNFQPESSGNYYYQPQQNIGPVNYPTQNIQPSAPVSYTQAQQSYYATNANAQRLTEKRKPKWIMLALSALVVLIVVIVSVNPQNKNQRVNKSVYVVSASTDAPTATPQTVKVAKPAPTQSLENKTPEELCQEGRYPDALELYLQKGDYSNEEKTALSNFVTYYCDIRYGVDYKFSPIQQYGSSAKDAAVYIEKNYKNISNGLIYQIYNVTEAALYYSIDDIFNQGFKQQGIDFAKRVDRNYTGPFAKEIIHLADYIQNGGSSTWGNTEKKETVTAQPTKKTQTVNTSKEKSSLTDVTDSDLRGFLYNTAIKWIKQQYPSYKNGKFPFSSYIGRDDVSIKTYTENGNTYYQVKMDVIVNQVTHGFSVTMLQKGTGAGMSVGFVSITKIY